MSTETEIGDQTGDRTGDHTGDLAGSRSGNENSGATGTGAPVLVGVDFDLIPWEKWQKPGAEGRVKIAYTQGLRVRLMELPAGFDEHEWCLRGHQGYVLQGEFTIHFEDRSVPCRPGMGFVIPDDEKHRSQGAEGEPTVVYVVDKVVPTA